MHKLRSEIIRFSRLFCVSTLFALGAYTGQAQAVSLSWSGPATGSVTVGDTFDVVLRFDGLSTTPGDSVMGFDFNVFYDTTAFQFVGGVFGDGSFNPLIVSDPGNPWHFASIEDLGGVIDISSASANDEADIDALQADSFIGFTLSFVALAASPAAAIGLDLGDPYLYLIGTDWSDMTVSMPSPSLTLSVTGQAAGGIPEPGILALLGLGIFGFGVLGATQQKKNVAI